MVCQAPPQILAAIFYPEALSAVCIATLRGPCPPSGVTPWEYLGYFGLTCAVEAPFYLAAGRFLGRPWVRVVVQVILLNLATHPLVVFAGPVIAGWANWSYLTHIAAAETFAPVAEALLLRWCARYPWSWAAGASLTANLASWWLGSRLF